MSKVTMKNTGLKLDYLRIKQARIAVGAFELFKQNIVMKYVG